ncbi:TonB-dependent receptor [Sphingorhabdus contaminans]|nr:TonB-dependent receptor [Sphingorhabdus contaminans]
MKTSFRIAMLASVCSLTLAAPAMAQSGMDTADETSGNDEIIVTATLREASVQDIPLAVTAISPTSLERQGVVDVKQLASISPSFSFQSTQTETSGIAIRVRGVGTPGNNAGLESSVGIFIDGVYQSRPGVALGELVDLERLELLRGPQGTLFGRNTSAGVLSISTKKPSLTDFDGFANVTYGNYDLMNLQAGVGGPISENVGFRLTGSWRKRDGYVESAGGAESHNKDRWILRGQLYFEPSADLSIRLIADYSKIDEKCCDGVIFRETELALNPANIALHGLPNSGVTFSGPSALRNLQTNGGQFFNGAKQWGFSGELKYNLGGAKLTYIGSYRDYESSSTAETDFVGLRIFTQGIGGESSVPGQPPTGDRIKSTTHELRIQGDAFDGKLDWLIGGFFGDEKIVSTATATLGTHFQAAASAFNFGTALGPNPLFAFTALGNGGIPVNAAGANAANQFNQQGKTYSIFTHNVFDLTDKLSLTLGARYVSETKDGSFDQLQGANGACQAVVNGLLSGAYNALPAAVRGGLQSLNCFNTATPVSITAPTGLGGGLASRFLPLPREFSDTFKDDELTYTAQISYKPNTDTLLYGSFSHGFKSGGFNLDPTAAILSNSAAVLTTGAAPQYTDPRFSSEKIDAYEVGFKATLGRINANVALFHMDINGFQQLEFNGLQFRTFNVGKVKSTGVEAELFGKLADYVSLNLSGTYLNTRYPSDCTAGIVASDVPTISRLCGAKLVRSPRFSSVAGLTYDGPLGGSAWGLLANVNLQYSDSFRVQVQPRDTNGTLFPVQENFFKVNARIGFTTPDKRFTVEFWGTNLSNEITRTVTANTPLRGVAGARSYLTFFDEPRTYGLTVRTKF